MVPEIKIRPAESGELEVLADLYEKLTRDQAAYDQAAKLQTNADFKTLVQGFLQSGNNKFFLAELDGKPAGFIRLNIYSGPNLEKVDPEAAKPPWKKFTPRRALRKILVLILDWLEKPLDTPMLFEQLRLGYIADMFVEAEARKKGLGTQLVQRALAWFKENKIDLVYLHALSGNQVGVSFWQKQGFSTYRLGLRKKI